MYQPLTLSPEEKIVKNSWKDVWPRMKLQEYRTGWFWLIFGEWSGYSSRQVRVVHLDFLSNLDAPLKLQGVTFTDGTTMRVWAQKVTRMEVIQRGLKRNLGYTKLINEAIKSGKEWFTV